MDSLSHAINHSTTQQEKGEAAKHLYSYKKTKVHLGFGPGAIGFRVSWNGGRERGGRRNKGSAYMDSHSHLAVCAHLTK